MNNISRLSLASVILAVVALVLASCTSKPPEWLKKSKAVGIVVDIPPVAAVTVPPPPSLSAPAVAIASAVPTPAEAVAGQAPGGTPLAAQDPATTSLAGADAGSTAAGGTAQKDAASQDPGTKDPIVAGSPADGDDKASVGGQQPAKGDGSSSVWTVVELVPPANLQPTLTALEQRRQEANTPR